MSAEYALQMIDIDKSFNGIKVLDKVDFSLLKGEIHAIIGGNGAGKSTLMKILTGVYIKDNGTVLINNQQVEIQDAITAEKHGIAMIFQEFSLIPTLTVAQNIFLAREPRKANGLVDDKECVRQTKEILDKLNMDIDPNIYISTLGAGYCQMVEIAKAISKNARILVMDEPTSSLSETETESLFEFVKQLKENGISIIYITHRMAEVFKICDRMTILKDGRTVLTDETVNMNMKQIVNGVMGTENEQSFEWVERKYTRGENPVLEVKNLAYGKRVKDVSFQIYPGEIVGLAGLMGSGRTEIMKCIFGIAEPEKGEIISNGKTITTTNEAMSNGIALVPENRRTQGLVLEHTVRDNIMLPEIDNLKKGMFVDDNKGTVLAETYVKKMNIRTDSINKVVRLLSGGNQQKVVLSKWLARNPKVLLLDEPTVGVDIGAKTEMLEIIRDLAQKGIAILVVSSELEELLAVSDRIMVLFNGKITKQQDRKEIISEEVLHHAIQGY